MSNKEGMSMKEIRIRKTRLKDDLELLEGSFENRISKAREKILGPFQPVKFIRSKPFQAIGIAVVAGIAVGILAKRRKRTSSSENSSGDSSANSGPGFTGILIDEVKRIAARRAASYITELVDQKLSDKKNN